MIPKISKAQKHHVVEELLKDNLRLELFKSLQTLPKTDRAKLYEIIYKHKDQLKWQIGADITTNRPTTTIDLFGFDSLSRSEQRYEELMNEPKAMRTDAERWFNGHSSYFVDCTLDSICTAIFHEQFGHPYDEITIRAPYKVARQLADFLKVHYNLRYENFCRIFLQKNGKPFKPTVLSQQPR